MLFVFFFKQMTAYEMRISDWSSDVCSSDLISRLQFENSRADDRHHIATLVRNGVCQHHHGARCNSQLSRLIHRRSENGIIQSDTAALISATGKREAPRSSRRSTATRSLRRALARLRGDHFRRSEHVDLASPRAKPPEQHRKSDALG